MTIYAIGGVSGTGKTHFRTHCRYLREARVVDIADVYEDSVAMGHPNLHWRTALERFVATVRGALEEDMSSDIVLEAFFRPNGVQRQAIKRLAHEFRVHLRWGWAWAPRSECLQRVSNQLDGEDSSERIEKRLAFISSAEPEFFRRIHGESLRRLAASARGAA